MHDFGTRNITLREFLAPWALTRTVAVNIATSPRSGRSARAEVGGA
jgi:hypothetical protein